MIPVAFLYGLGKIAWDLPRLQWGVGASSKTQFSWVDNGALIAIPLVSLLSRFIHLHPRTYFLFYAAPDSLHQPLVHRVIRKILTNENRPGGRYYAQIQTKLKNLPCKGSPQTIDSWIQQRLKVTSVFSIEMFNNACAAGTEQDSERFKGKFIIDICSAHNKHAADALPFIISHELGHILANDIKNILNLRIIVSLAAALFSRFALPLWSDSGSTPIKAVGLNLAISFLTNTFYTLHREYQADEFAIEHVSAEDLKKAIPLLQELQEKQEKSLFQRISTALLSDHPSAASRIKRIQKAILDKQSFPLSHFEKICNRISCFFITYNKGESPCC